MKILDGGGDFADADIEKTLRPIRRCALRASSLVPDEPSELCGGVIVPRIPPGQTEPVHLILHRHGDRVRMHEVRAECHHQGRLEMPGMTGERAEFRVRLDTDESVPRERPVRGRANREMFQQTLLTRDEADEFVVAAVPIEEVDAPCPHPREAIEEVTQDALKVWLPSDITPGKGK